MAEQKEKIKLKDIFNRNLILILLIQLFADMSNNMANSFINMGAKAAGVGVAAIGIAASAYAIAGMIMRMPAGSLASSDKKKMALIGTLIFRAAAHFILGTFGVRGDMNFIVARTLYGAAWSTVGIVLPAVVAMMMDKKVMGTTYAILAIFQQFSKQMVRALGVKLYQDYGMVTALVAAISFAVVAVVLVMFLDFNDPRIIAATPKKRPSGLKGINLKYVPICLILSIAVFTWTLCNQYNNVLAQDRNIDLASILVITSVVSSVTGFCSSALCDLIHPKYVLMALYVCLGVGTVILGGADTYNMFLIGEILCTVGMSYSKAISIFLYKTCDETEKAMVHATNYLMTDILNICAGTLVGTLLAKTGYTTTYTVMAFFTFATAVILLLFGTRLMNINGSKAEA